MANNFNFETSLENKGITKNELPDNISNKLTKLIDLCKKLAETPDEDDELIIELGEEIDNLDDEISSDIDLIKIEAPTPPVTPDSASQKPNKDETIPVTPSTDDPPQPQEKDNTLATVGLVAGLGLLVFGLYKMFGGKK